MRHGYWFLYLLWLVKAVPLAAGAVAVGVRRMTVARALVLVWLGVVFAEGAVQYILAGRHVNNHWLSYVTAPVAILLLLAALAQWQVRPRVRRGLLVAAPLAVLGLVLAIPFEDTTNFSRVADPLVSLTVFVVALVTMAARALESTEPARREDWFWCCLGLALAHGASASLSPFAAAYATRVDLLTKAYILYAFIMAPAMLALTVGVLCPVAPRAATARS